MSDERIEGYLAKQEIYELACKYCRALDRLDAELMRSVFFEDAYCEYGFYNGPPAQFAEFAMGALGGHAANQHMLGNVLIEVEGDEAFGEVYFHAYHKLAAASGSGFDDLVIAGRYIDRYEKRDGVWKIAYRSERNDWSRTTPTNDPYFDMAPNGLRGSRADDAVYDKTNRHG
jgi:hypothetical protein